MTDSTNPVETSTDMQSRSLPTRRYTSRRCYVTKSYIGKLEHLLLGQPYNNNWQGFGRKQNNHGIVMEGLRKTTGILLEIANLWSQIRIPNVAY